MNIDQYRALKAQQEADAKNSTAQPEEQINAQANPSATEPESTHQTQKPTESTPTTPEPKGETPPSPSTITIDGQEVTLDQIKEWQQGHMRTSDYTRKTQELARERKEMEQALFLFEQIKNNPELQQQVGYNAHMAEYQQLQQNYYDLLVQQEVNELSKKYDDFDVVEVLTVARDKNLENLEDAYFFHKSMNLKKSQLGAPKSQESKRVEEAPAPVVDADALRAQIKEELLRELQAEANTSTIISTNSVSAPTSDDTPQLSEAEKKVAQRMKMSFKDYATWRGKKSK